MHEVTDRYLNGAALSDAHPSGFNRDDEWGFRAVEPSRCCISSIALVLLKTGIMHHPPGPTGERPVTIDYNQMATAQKLLLFWRKPAVGPPVYHRDSAAERVCSVSVGGMAWRSTFRNLGLGNLLKSSNCGREESGLLSSVWFVPLSRCENMALIFYIFQGLVVVISYGGAFHDITI